MLHRRQAVLGLTSGLVAAFGSGPLAARPRPAPLTGAAALARDLDLRLEAARLGWRSPGLAVGVVQNGQLIYAKGTGTAQVGQTTPINPDTSFGIASLTKAFTSACVALLVDAGKLDWDAPVVTYLPEFRTSGGAAYDGITLRDMLSHRTGLGRHDLIWYNNQSLKNTDLLARLPFLEMAAPLRASYSYNNIMYILAGLVVERVSGQSFERFCQSRLLDPLGMTRTFFTVDARLAAGNFAKGHKLLPDGTPVDIPFRPEDAIGAAGEISSSIADFARWIGLHLGNGALGAQRLISPGAMAALREPVIATGGVPEQAELTRGYYGLGWRLDSYRGMTRIAHGGNLNGFSARVTLFPDQGVGIVAFANLRGTPVPGHVSLDIMDALMGLPPVNWSDRALQRRDAARANPRPDTAPKPVANTVTSRPLAGFAGRYRHKGYGNMWVEADAGGLRATYNGMGMRLTHWHYDVFTAHPTRVDDDDLDGVKFGFRSGLDGTIEDVEVTMDTDMPPSLFVRQQDVSPQNGG